VTLRHGRPNLYRPSSGSSIQSTSPTLSGRARPTGGDRGTVGSRIPLSAYPGTSSIRSRTPTSTYGASPSRARIPRSSGPVLVPRTSPSRPSRSLVGSSPSMRSSRGSGSSRSVGSSSSGSSSSGSSVSSRSSSSSGSRSSSGSAASSRPSSSSGGKSRGASRR
jgi:hypothetical protein